MFSFLLLLLGHIFADFFLQLTRLGAYKRKKILALTAHALIWALILSLALIITGSFSPWKLYFLFFTHFAIDWLKIRLFKATFPILNPVNVLDQLLHLATILVVLAHA
ncbi:MAG: hypothetical protein A4E53_03799 [Pelotomaculum sp. PtaB.Bin104]|nr:MAG: hypothetical protein A4E53_03799 [Pelotomaculum sp. PtaB.Bin104]